jgi:hypothetical protein
MWLYVPHDKMKINDVAKFSKKYNIPEKVIFNKYAVYLKNQNKTPEEILNELLKYYDDVEPDILANLLRDECAVPPSPEEIFNALELMKPFKNISVYGSSASHDTYPELDIIKGRPYINWKECYHTACHKTYASEMLLKEHLTLCNALTHRFHTAHEEIVEHQKLTPEIILKQNMTKCPSVICDIKNFKTPKDLVRHFKLLGVKPFWIEGTTTANILEETAKQNRIVNDIQFIGGTLQQVYSVESCIVCFEHKPFIMFVSCCHHVCCFNCFTRFKPRECFICKKKIEFIVPY